MKQQTIIGLVLLALLLVSSAFILETSSLYFRLLIGLGFGYALARASMGFAGSVNRLARTGSSTLASALIIMFVVTAFVTTFFIYGNEETYSLNIYPINFALLLGGLMFGFGMTFSSCCATGSLTDLSSGFSRAIVAIFFLSMGVFLGFNVQASSFVTHSYISSATGAKFQGGVFLPDLFTFDGLNGYAGAMLLTIILAGVAIYLARYYEKRYYAKYGFNPSPPEAKQELSKTEAIFDAIFIRPWKMRVSVVIVALLFGSLLFLYDKGWSASSAFGLWFAKFLMLFGVSTEWIASFTHKSLEYISTPLLADGTSVQNFSIILGAFFYLLLAGKFKNKFRAGLAITPKDFAIYAFGGFIMGLGTRLSQGCNVGALYTPIAELSLSGWLYMVVVVIGGFSGNKFVKKYINKTCKV